MTEKQVNNLIKKGEWQKLLKAFCKSEKLKVNFIDLPDKCKRIEISKNGEMIDTLQSLVSEDNFNDISQALMSKLMD